MHSRMKPFNKKNVNIQKGTKKIFGTQRFTQVSPCSRSRIAWTFPVVGTVPCT